LTLAESGPHHPLNGWAGRSAPHQIGEERHG
jgi:hypothetical protein